MDPAPVVVSRGVLAPPVLVLSLARSGSSWTGEVLGHASNALYLREPVTQGAAEQGDQTFYYRGTVFPLDDELEPKYRALADRAFAAEPTFGPAIRRFPAQWTSETPRRLVVKEVNPRACAWYLERYRPRLVLLVRHPAAVALSWQRHGWVPPTPGGWAFIGRHQAEALRDALAASSDYLEHRIVQDQALCADPLQQFLALFEFAGLAWDQSSREFVSASTEPTSDRARPTGEMVDAWRGQMPPEHLSALRDAYRTFDLPWYQHDSEW